MVKPPRIRRRRQQRGISLIEVLVALLLLMFITLGIAQMFSMALMVNQGARARTELMYQAQQTAEAIRWIYSFEERDPDRFAALSTASGVDLATQTSPATLPYASGQTGWNFWGPDGFNVVHQNAPYRLVYEVTTGAGVGRFQLTVMARPAEGGGAGYLGGVTRAKAVRYVAFIP